MGVCTSAFFSPGPWISSFAHHSSDLIFDVRTCNKTVLFYYILLKIHLSFDAFQEDKNTFCTKALLSFLKPNEFDKTLRINGLRDTVLCRYKHASIGCCYTLHVFLNLTLYAYVSSVCVFSCTLKLSLKVICLVVVKKVPCIVKQITVRRDWNIELGLWT